MDQYLEDSPDTRIGSVLTPPRQAISPVLFYNEKLQTKKEISSAKKSKRKIIKENKFGHPEQEKSYLTLGTKYLDQRRHSVDQALRHALRRMSVHTVAALYEKHLKLNEKNQKKSIFKRKPWIIPLVIGLAFILFSAVSFTSLDKIVLAGFLKELEIREGSSVYPAWEALPAPIESEYWLFSIKNPKQFLAGAKPVVEEHGPYCYKEFRYRKVIEWKKDTVTFSEKYKFRFMGSKSASQSERLMVINYPLVSILYVIQSTLSQFRVGFLNPLVQTAMATVLRASGENIIEPRTAYEVLEGRKIDLIVFINNVLKPLKDLGIPLPDLNSIGEGSTKLRNQTYGFVWQRADVENGPFEVYRRYENDHVFSGFYRIDGKETVGYFRPPCNSVSASDGMHFGIMMENKPFIEIYHPFTCRKLKFIRVGNNVTTGIPVVRYVLDKKLMDMRYKENRCYCIQDSLAKCDGWTDISPCTTGVKLGISFPHFMHTPRLASTVLGLKPDPSKHLSYVDVEPHIGFPVRANIVVQLNVLLENTLPGLSNINRVVMPIMWTKQVGAPDPMSRYKMVAVSFLFRHGNLVIGSFQFLSGIGLLAFALRQRSKSRKTKPTD